MAILIKVHFRNQKESDLVSEKALYTIIGRALAQADFEKTISPKKDFVLNRTLDGDNKQLSVEIIFSNDNVPFTGEDVFKIRDHLVLCFGKKLEKEYVFFHKTAF